MVESLYFTYFYIRAFIEERGVEYVTYVSVYISRGINAISEGPCWKIGKKKEPSEAEIESELLKKTDLPHVKAAFSTELTEEEKEKIDKGTQAIFDELKNSLATVNAFLLIMEVLEILIDALTFKDVFEKNDYFDAGIMSGKGVINAGFTSYYLVMQYWKPDEDHSLDWEKEPPELVIDIDVDPVVVE